MGVCAVIGGNRLGKAALWAAGLLALFALVGFFVVPPVAKSIIVKEAGKALGREVSIERIAVNPFALTATVSGFRLYEQGSKEVFASVAEVHVNLESSSVWNLAPVVSALRITEPRLKIVRLEETRFNFTDILETLARRPKSDEPLHFSVNNIELADGQVDIDDRVEQAQHAITDIRLGVPFVSNLPTKVAIKVTPAFAAKFNETAIDLKGETVPFQDTLESSLQVSLDDFVLGRYLRYVPATLAFEVPSGTLSTDLRVYFIRAKDKPQRLTVSGTVQVRDLSLVDSDKAPLLSLPLLDLDIESIDVFARNADISKVTLERLSMNAVREKDGRINLLSLATRPVPGSGSTPEAAKPAPGQPGDPKVPPPAQEPLRNAAGDFHRSGGKVSVTELALSGGKISVTDRMPVQPFRAELSEIEVAAKGLSNEGSEPARIVASLRSSLGETLKADASVVIAPLSAEGTVELAGLRPRNYAPYYGPLVRLEIDEARVAASTGFRLAAAGGSPPGKAAEGFDVSISGLELTVSDLRTRRQGDKEPLLDLKALSVKGVDADLAKRTASIGEFIARDGSVRVVRDKDGRVNLATLLAGGPAGNPAGTVSAASVPGDAGGTAAAVPAPEAPWTWSLKRAALERLAVRFSDQVPAEPVAIELSDIAATVEDLNSTRGSRAKAALKLAINRTGSIAAKGQFGIEPAVATFEFDARSIGVLPLQPYFTDRLNIVITSGDVSAKGTLSADTSAQPLRASFTGEANIANFAALERANDEELLRWKSLFFGGMNLTAGPTQVAIAEIALSDFFSRVILSEKGRLNLLDLVRPDPALPAPGPADDVKKTGAVAPVAASGKGAATVAPTTADSPLPFPVKIGRITLASGNINFSDFFVRPNFRLNLTGMTGSVSTLTSEPGTTADLDLRGQLDGAAPVAISGRLNPIATPLFVDIKGSVRGAELSTLSPYSTKYTGYGIERGRLTLNVAYKVEGRKVDAQHRIFLDQLTFSTERIEGPAVVKLPIQFAVRLLQNSRGEIDLNLPISGTLDDPKFRIGPIIWQIVVNLITRAVTAPFSLLASLGGGSAEELSRVDFAPGRADLSDAAQKNLATLGKALADRPTLRLEIAGGVDLNTDVEGYRRAELDGAVRAQKARALARKGEPVPDLERITLDPKEYETYLRAAYREAKFPKPRNAIGMLRDLPVPEMEALMLTNTEVTADDLRELALARSRTVEMFLVNKAGVSPERVFLVTFKPGSGDEKSKTSASRVDMTIR